MIPDKNLTHVAFHVAKERCGTDEDKFGPPANTDIARLESLPPFQVASELGFVSDRLQAPDGRELEPWVKRAVRQPQCACGLSAFT